MSTFPLVWGHRGASVDFPENTLASFDSAARAGANGIESDVHISKDDVIIMFHDHDLGRTTVGGTGEIKSQNYYGNIENLKTVKKPEQKIPTFEETIRWLHQPENQHLVFNIDVKPGNDPERLFTLMQSVLSRTAPDDWETSLAPRLLLGLWHPKFVKPAVKILPSVKRCFIGVDLAYAQKPIFWNNLQAYSIAFPMLAGYQGRAFRERCRREGKDLYVWTLNSPDEWTISKEWGVDVVMTDKPVHYLEHKRKFEESKSAVPLEDPWFMWKSFKYYQIGQWAMRKGARVRLEHFGGPIAPFLDASEDAQVAAVPPEKH